MTGRTTIGLGIGLMLLGVFMAFNGGAALMESSPNEGEYRLAEVLTIDQSSRAVMTKDVELLRGHYKCYSATPIFRFSSAPDDVRVQGTATGSDPLFVGIAPADAAAEYLDGVAHDEITDWDCSMDEISDVVYVSNEGETDPVAPGTEGFWVASVSGSGEQTLDWTIESGEWALVIMNADGSPGVSADVRFGGLAPSGLAPLGWGSLAAGIGALIGGFVALVRGVGPGSPLPSGPDEAPRWTLWGHSVLPTTVEGRIAAIFGVLWLGPVILGAPIFLVLALRKGDRSLLLLLPLLASMVIVMFAIVLVFQIPGA